MATSAEKKAMKKALAEARADAAKAAGPSTSSAPNKTAVKPSGASLKPKIEAKNANNKYADIDEITVSVAKSSGEWDDNSFNQISVHDISQLSTDDAVLYGKAMIHSINVEEITSDTVLMMLHLAVSIRSTTGIANHMLSKPEGFTNYMAYKKPSAEEEIEVVDVQEDDEVLLAVEAANTSASGSKSNKKKKKKKAAAAVIGKIDGVRGSGKTPEENEDDKESQAAAYSYVAAYLMRMQCRQASTTADNFDRFKTRYAGFYDLGRSTITNFSPSAAALESIKEVIARKPEITSTWVAWVAYNENEVRLAKQDKGLLEYLAIQVFAYQGMHVVVQILAIHQQSHVPLGMLLREMDCQITRSSVKEVYRIMRDYQPNDRHPRRKTYFRYARVWDDGYFTKVQSKHCPQLLYLAAKVVKELSPNTNSDPTKIYAVANMGDTLRNRLDMVAENLLDLIITAQEDDEEAGSIWKKR